MTLSDVLDTAIDALDGSEYGHAFASLEAYVSRRCAGEAEPFEGADRRCRDAWCELALAAGPGEAWRLARTGR